MSPGRRWNTTMATHPRRFASSPSEEEPQPAPAHPEPRRRRCKFIGEWLGHRHLARWLRPVRGDEHKARCLLCDKSFSVAHGGFHDVRAHWKGKRHMVLQAQAASRKLGRLQRRPANSLRGGPVEDAAPLQRQGQQESFFDLVLSTKEKESDLRSEHLAVQERGHADVNSFWPSDKDDSTKRRKQYQTEPEDAIPRETERFGDSDRFAFRPNLHDWSSHLDDLGKGSSSSSSASAAEAEEAAVVAGGSPSLARKESFSSREGLAAADTLMLQQGSGPGPVTPPAASSNNMFPQQYCLRWKYHHSNLQTMFSQLLARQAYCDVTLACEGSTLRAHKVVLSACSTYFDTILSQFEEKYPIVIMRDVTFSDMKVLLDFMYKGEINIDHTRLSSLLKTAEDLHIKGLAEVSWRSDSGQNDLSNSGHSPGSGPPGVETVLREGNETDEPPPPKQRRRGRPPLDDPPSAHDVFTPKITCITGNVGTDCTLSVNKQEEMSEGDHESWDDEMMMPESNEAPMPILSYMPKEDSVQDQEKKAVNTSTNSNAMNPAIPEQFRDVIKMNDYLTTGRRQEFWEEPFTRRVMDAIKSKELEMKTAAEILGVSYGTLYGRYRDSYGCLKHPYRVRDFWSEPGPAEILAKLRRKEITLFRAAEFLNVTVHTLATYLSTLQGPDRISLAGDLSVAAAGAVVPMDVPSNNEANNTDSMNDILQKINANASGAPTAAAPTTSATIKREGGGYVELPAVGVVPKAASSVLENNPDITIVKTEGMQRKRVEYTKLTATENNNAKLMSGGAVSELSQPQLTHPGQQSQQPTPQQQLVTAQTTVQQQLQQQHQHHQQQHQQKLADTLSINNDISKP